MAVDRASDNPFPSVLFAEHVDPSNPDAGYKRLFVDTDHILKTIDSSGTIVQLGQGLTDPMTTRGDIIYRNASNVTDRLGRGTSGQVLTSDGTDLSWQTPSAAGAMATDALWDAAGDLAVGTGANTGARLAIGNAGGVLARINGAVAWNASTSFPTAATGDRFFRTDRGIEYYYDGTRWLSMTLYRHNISNQGALVPMSANGSMYSAMWAGLYDLYMVDFFTNSAVITTNTGSAYWTIALTRGPSSTSLASYTTAADTVNVNTGHRVAINALAGTSDTYFAVDATKTSTPGNLYLTAGVTYRLVG